MRIVAVILPALLATVASLGADASAHRLTIDVRPHFGRTSLAFDRLTNSTAAGQLISVTRLDFLASGFELRLVDGRWIEAPNRFGFVNAREGRTGMDLGDVPAGRYDRLRFHVGLEPAENHGDPAQHPSGHPFNPAVNGLHWSWQGGYVFFALEGQWRDRVATPTLSESTSGIRGYSFHVATDRQLAAVELPIDLDLTRGSEVRLALDVERILGGAHGIRITDETASTHSRVGDPLADQLRENIQAAFSLEGIRAVTTPLTAGRSLDKVEIAPTATPYRLVVSRFFPRPTLPLDNPLTDEGVELGRRLFHEPLLSINSRQSCASCHRAGNAFCDVGRPVSLGAEGQGGSRNAMPLFNLAWKPSFFWDGRALTLREQVLQPIQNPREMHESLAHVVAKLAVGRRAQSSRSDAADYPELFERAFGTTEITADRVARALEQFLLTLVSHDSKFDRVLKGETKLAPDEQRGFELFHTEYDPPRRQYGADCFHCHGGPLFRSQAFANNGLDANPSDLGHFLATGREGDRGKFAVPSLRNVAVTAPYMHDGRFATLDEVIAHYCSGVRRSSTLDPNLAKHPDGGVPLNAADRQALVSFLKTLTDQCYLSVPPGSLVGND